jgi:putative methionine-R-sulfoxide reductase with GAF domain
VKEEGYEHVIDQLWVVSQLAVTKYELIRWALYLLAVAGVLVLAAFVGDHRYH